MSQDHTVSDRVEALRKRLRWRRDHHYRYMPKTWTEQERSRLLKRISAALDRTRTGQMKPEAFEKFLDKIEDMVVDIEQEEKANRIRY